MDRIASFLNGITLSGILVLFFFLQNQADLDLWGMMAHGALLAKSFPAFPYEDIFSYTAPGHPWIYHEWGAGSIFYQTFLWLGSPGLFFLKLFLFLATGYCIWRCALPHNKPEAKLWIFRTLPLLVFVGLMAYTTTLRAHTFSLFFFALILWLLENTKETRKSFLIPLVMLCWANIHGGFAMGLLLLLIYRSWPTLILSLLIVLINPYGLDFITEIISAWSLDRSGIVEWGNVFGQGLPYGLAYTLAFVLWGGLATYSLYIRKRFSAPEILIFLIGLAGGLHVKLAPFFAITVLAVGNRLMFPEAKLQTPAEPLPIPIQRALSGTLAAIVITVVAGYCVLFGNPVAVKVPGSDFSEKGGPLRSLVYPMGAVQFLKQRHIKGNVWSTFEWGEFLLWELYPHCKVAMDGRYETAYPVSVFEDHQAFFTPPYTVKNALKYPTTHLLIPASSRELLEQIEKDFRWLVMYRDEVAVIFTKPPVATVPFKAHSNATQTLDYFQGFSSSSSR